MTYTRADHDNDIRHALEQRDRAVAGLSLLRPRLRIRKAAVDAEFNRAIVAANGKLEAAHKGAIDHYSLLAEDSHALRAAAAGALEQEQKAHAKTRSNLDERSAQLAAEQASHAGTRRDCAANLRQLTEARAALAATRRELDAEQTAHTATRTAHDATTEQLTELRAAHAELARRFNQLDKLGPGKGASAAAPLKTPKNVPAEGTT
jgi:chromosome segregation ATPase